MAGLTNVENGVVSGRATRMARDAGLLDSGALRLERLAGGANNRVYRATGGPRPMLLKVYLRDPGGRDRLAAEYSFARCAWDAGLRALAEPLACDSAGGLGLYELLEGSPPTPADVGDRAVDQASAFVADLAVAGARGLGERLPDAAEACFSLVDHLSLVHARVERLTHLDPVDDIDDECRTFARDLLVPAWDQVRSRSERRAAAAGVELTQVLPHESRVISPSDFGFHNAIVDDAGTFRFVDFEYAGWDDPAKLVCDFFCQPAVPVPTVYQPRFVSRLLNALPTAAQHELRIQILLPVYRLKWCCILLNDFLPSGQTRRGFALTGDPRSRRRGQLVKAKDALRSVAIEANS